MTNLRSKVDYFVFVVVLISPLCLITPKFTLQIFPTYEYALQSAIRRCTQIPATAKILVKEQLQKYCNLSSPR